MPLTVFITGASSGIGLALAQAYAAQGATLGLVARRGDTLQQLADSLTAGWGCQVHAQACDVTQAQELAQAAQAFMASHGVPDVVIACAGISLRADIERAQDLELFEQVLATNTLGTFATFQPFVTAMRTQGHGKLVAVASVAGVRGLPGAGAYCASKAAVIAWCESLRVDLRGSGVQVITLSPGYVSTPMTEGLAHAQPFLIAPEAFAQRAIAAIAAGRREAVIPWQMGWVAKLLKLMPNALYDRLMHKARSTPDTPN